jgi:O-antigen/teichoic acid export membrane protein
MASNSHLEPGAKIVRGSFIILIDYILVVGFGVTYTVVIARLLGSDGYGILATGLALLNILAGIAGFGISGALTRLVSKYVALKKPGAVREVLRISLKYIVASGLIFSAVLFLLAGPIAGNIYHNSELTNVFRLVAITILPFLLITALLGTFQGFQRMRYNLFTEGSSAVLRLPFAIGLVVSGYFATGALLGTAMGMTVGCLLGFYFLLKLWPKRSEEGDGKLSREIMGFALPTWAGSFAWAFVLGYGTLLLGNVTNFHEVGFYSSAFWIISVMLYIPGIVGVPLFPLVSELWTLKDKEKLSSTIKISAKIIFTILIPFIVAIAVFPEFILTLIYGKDFAAGSNALRILAMALLFMSIKSMNDSILSGVGRPDVNARINASTAAIAVVTITPLAWFFGIQGAAAGFLIAQILASCVGIFFVNRLTGLTYSLSVFRITALAAGVMLIFLIPLRYLAVNFLQAVAIGVGALIIYALACLVLGAVEKDDVNLLRLISSDMGEPKVIVKVIRFLDKFAK